MHPLFAIPATIGLGYRAKKHNALTSGGIAAAVVTAIAHAYHPWNLPFVLLFVFYLLGSRATKVKHNVKKSLTLPAKGDAGGGEGPRTHVQVFANSIIASVLCVVHARHLAANPLSATCYGFPDHVLILGLIAQYAATTADTLSSELGILSKSEPRLITSGLTKSVPRGTNGGVSLLGLAAGFGGALVIGVVSVLVTPLCHEWTVGQKIGLALVTGMWGLLGSLLDSFLGALLQRTVRDVHTGKVIEGEGGVRVLVDDQNGTIGGNNESDGKGKASREVVTGWDVLDNNEVNLAMAAIMTFGAMVLGKFVWDY